MKLIRRKPVQAAIAVGAAAVLAFAGLGIASAASSPSPVAAKSNLYGCVSGPDRVLKGNYTVAQNFVDNGGCSKVGGFPVTVGDQPVPGVTTPPPTPTPTPTIPTPTPTTAACVTSANFGTCPSGGGWYNAFTVSPNNAGSQVIQNVWNHVNITQTLTANSATDWSVSATATGTAVQSYPDTQQTTTTSVNHAQPLTPDVSSSFTQTVPANGDWEAAWDLWLGSTTTTSQYNQEVMIWTNTLNQRPSGSDTGKTVTLGSTVYEIWASSQGNPVSLVAKTNALSGSVDLTTAVNALISGGYVAGGEGFSQIDYGYEICSTNGSPETFAVTGYTLTS